MNPLAAEHRPRVPRSGSRVYWDGAGERACGADPRPSPRNDVAKTWELRPEKRREAPCLSQIAWEGTPRDGGVNPDH